MLNQQLLQTREWLLVICADARAPLDLLLLPPKDLRQQWAPFFNWIPNQGIDVRFIVEALRSALLDDMIRISQRPPIGHSAEIEQLEVQDAIELLQSYDLPQDRILDEYEVEFTEPGAIAWEETRRPNWEQFYTSEWINEDETKKLETIEVRTQSRNRLTQLLDKFCEYYDYSEKRGIQNLTIWQERPWQATYWRTLESCWCASFEVFRRQDLVNESCRDATLVPIFQRWRFDA